ncbi:MAG TPA: ATP-binding protein [Polyangiaceae bacterium]|nr:ATP-binding protein [Polyangiaceae bacterium]
MNDSTAESQLRGCLTSEYELVATTIDELDAECARGEPALVLIGCVDEREPASSRSFSSRAVSSGSLSSSPPSLAPRSAAEVVVALRARRSLASTPVLLLTRPAGEAHAVSLLDRGAHDYVVWPCLDQVLRARTRNLISLHEAQRDAALSTAREQMTRREFEQLRGSAESGTRAKEEFLAMLGHELRNPLSPILTALQLMRLQGPEVSDRARTVIERQVNHLTRLVDDLLDVARIARGKVELKQERLEISVAVAKAIELASPLLEQRKHALSVSVPNRGLCVNGDVARLSQVISNLLTNAAKYTSPGGQITISAEAVADQVEIAVSDTGMGIAPEVLPHIFEAFVQERQAIDRSQGGLGIGLTIVRNIVEQHGGSVSAGSQGPGRGSRFLVRLPRLTAPLSEAAEAPPKSEPAKMALCGHALRILVVDDNEDGAEMLALALSRRGYETRVAHDAPTALRAAAEFAPDVAFLDIGLPVMDGYELAAHLRLLPGLTGLRLIAVTGYGQESDRRKTREAGFQQHLVKPVNIEIVEAALLGRGECIQEQSF